MFVVGDIGMVDLGLEIELRRLERVVGRQNEEKFEFTTLMVVVSIRIIFNQVELTAYGEPSGPSRTMFHLWTSASSIETWIPVGGWVVTSEYSLVIRF